MSVMYVQKASIWRRPISETMMHHFYQNDNTHTTSTKECANTSLVSNRSEYYALFPIYILLFSLIKMHFPTPTCLHSIEKFC